MGDALNYIEDGMPCSSCYTGKPISVEIPRLWRARYLHGTGGRGDTSARC